MNRQLLATALAYALGLASLAGITAFVATRNWTWMWAAAGLWVGAVIVIVWLWNQPLPRERSIRGRR